METVSESLLAATSQCRHYEGLLNEKLKALQEQIKTELTPLIGKEIKVAYQTTDAYAVKHGRTIEEFVGTLEGFSRNGFLHITDHKLGVYQNIRPMRIIDIKIY